MTTQPTSSSDSITLAAAGPSSTKTEIPPLSDAYPAIVPGGYLCLAWVLKNKRVLIVGGGPVAAGRLVNVKDADAHVTVICPSSGLNGEMKYRLARGEIDVYHDRLFGGEHELDDADHKETNPSGEPALTPRSKYDLVLTATDDESLSRAICNIDGVHGWEGTEDCGSGATTTGASFARGACGGDQQCGAVASSTAERGAGFEARGATDEVDD
ncbi:Bifunctional dehydrogenase and ferrochelatase [Tilletia horrida]|nr:Bifunctional dehydrogenase and ferrochelatase [Tilletia horrida]